MDSNDPLVNGGKVRLINQDELQRTLGRIEEALTGLRRDLQDLIVEQREHNTRLDALDDRVGKLEGWQARRELRYRWAGRLAAILLLPGIVWVQQTIQTIDHILDMVQQHNKKP